ncbi:MAG: maltose ABC transporter permease MalF, partial [Myxococcota bacterium]
DGSLTNNETGKVVAPDIETGFYRDSDGNAEGPGFQVDIGFMNFVRLLTQASLREPFIQIFIWNVTFAGLTVLFALIVGFVLSELMSWESLRYRGFYQLMLFIPYAVPSFISILVFKGLFNEGSGEINLLLEWLFGIKPNWVSDPFMAKVMLLIVNTWLGYPYMMLLCMGLRKSIPGDLYEASAVEGSSTWNDITQITWPLIRKPLMPLLISSFAFNFNNFVLIILLTGGRPDIIGTTVPAGETDLLVTYAFRVAFENNEKEYGLAGAIATMIFFMVAILSVINLKLTNVKADETA